MSLIFAPSALRMVRGTTWADTVQLLDETTNLPISLVGVTAAIMRVRTRIDSATVLLELSIANGRLTIVDAALGLIGISVSAALTISSLPRANDRKTKYVYDCLLSRGGDPEIIEPGFKGKLTVYPQVSRSIEP